MITDEFLRVIIEDREREVQQHLRSGLPAGLPRRVSRWFNRGSRIERTRPSARGR